MTYKALIPVKRLTEVKSRLAPHLSQKQRADLVLEMLRHVIDALQTSNALDAILVVSADPHVLAQASAWGAQPSPEEVPGHNEALHAAAIRERNAGTGALLTISADLPLLHPDDIRQMRNLAEGHAVVLAPSRDGTGTNALLTRPPLAIPYRFGPGSFQLHREAAQDLGLQHTLYTSIGSALDIDVIDDLTALKYLKAEAVRNRNSLVS